MRVDILDPYDDSTAQELFDLLGDPEPSDAWRLTIPRATLKWWTASAARIDGVLGCRDDTGHLVGAMCVRPVTLFHQGQDRPAIVLGPLCVRPDLRHRRVLNALVTQTHAMRESRDVLYMRRSRSGVRRWVRPLDPDALADAGYLPPQLGGRAAAQQRWRLVPPLARRRFRPLLASDAEAVRHLLTKTDPAILDADWTDAPDAVQAGVGIARDGRVSDLFVWVRQAIQQGAVSIPVARLWAIAGQSRLRVQEALALAKASGAQLAVADDALLSVDQLERHGFVPTATYQSFFWHPYSAPHRQPYPHALVTL